MSTQEKELKSFFYPKVTMGTTIMAIKYDGGVIACADSRTLSITKAPLREERTLSTESPTRSTSSTITSSSSEVELQDNPNKLPTKSGISSILTSTSRAASPT